MRSGGTLLTITTVQRLLAGNCNAMSRLLLTHAESLLRCYDRESLVFMRDRTILEIDMIEASLYPKEKQSEHEKAHEQLTVLDLILDYEEDGGEPC